MDVGAYVYLSLIYICDMSDAVHTIESQSLPNHLQSYCELASAILFKHIKARLNSSVVSTAVQAIRLSTDADDWMGRFLWIRRRGQLLNLVQAWPRM